MTPIEKLNPHKKWWRFNSLPEEVQDAIVDLLFSAKGCGYTAIAANARLEKMLLLSDAALIQGFADYKSRTSNCLSR